MDGKLRNEIRIWLHRDALIPSLDDVIAMVRDPDLTWVMTDFQASQRPGTPPLVVALEKQVLSAPGGVEFSWDDIIGFAQIILQCIDLDITGYDARDTARSSPRIMVTAFDSTFWSIEFERFEDVDLSAVPSLLKAQGARGEQDDVSSPAFLRGAAHAWQAEEGSIMVSTSYHELRLGADPGRAGPGLGDVLAVVRGAGLRWVVERPGPPGGQVDVGPHAWEPAGAGSRAAHCSWEDLDSMASRHPGAVKACGYAPGAHQDDKPLLIVGTRDAAVWSVEFDDPRLVDVRALLALFTPDGTTPPTATPSQPPTQAAQEPDRKGERASPAECLDD